MSPPGCVGASAASSMSRAASVIGTDEMALAVRAGHPLSAGTLTLQGFADAVHIVVSRRGLLHGPVDAVLEAHGLRRRVAALPLPFPLHSVPALVSWHRRHDTDPAHRWLRDTVGGIIAARLRQ